MSEKKIKPRFNVIDVLIIVLLVAVLWVFAMYADFGGNAKVETTSATEKETVQYTVEIKGIREENVGAYSVGDEIIGTKGKPIGKIVSMSEYTNETAITENRVAKKFVVSEIPNKYSVKLVIESPCTKEEYGIKVDGTYTIKVGKKVNIKTDKYVASSTILEVKED